MLEQHRSNPLCSACHARFDSLGLAFEGYGPTGEAAPDRSRRPPHRCSRRIPRRREGRRPQWRRGLHPPPAPGRLPRQPQPQNARLRPEPILQLSDEELVAQAQQNLAQNDYRFSALFETIVTSPQFLNRRADAEPAQTGE
ncbi:MAG: DUF1588 domain-containing protein [Bryobacterales bacterium]